MTALSGLNEPGAASETERILACVREEVDACLAAGIEPPSGWMVDLATDSVIKLVPRATPRRR